MSNPTEKIEVSFLSHPVSHFKEFDIFCSTNDSIIQIVIDNYKNHLFREKREEVEGFILVMVMVMAMVIVVKLMALVLELLRVLNTVVVVVLMVVVLMVVVVMGKSNLVREKKGEGVEFQPRVCSTLPGIHWMGRRGGKTKESGKDNSSP